MRNAKEVLDEIINWAEKNDDVRAVMLTGSRANVHEPANLLSDYDIEIAVNHINQFLHNEAWLSVFGEILTVVRLDDSFTLRMVLYKDYVRIDFRIHSLKDFKQYTALPELPNNWDIGYVILCDKDHVKATLKPPTYKAYEITKPSAEEFLAIVSDFWWDTTYVAKSLWRDELFYAKYMSDNIIRFSYLQKVIEWYVASQHNWKITINKFGRRFKKFLDAGTWKELESGFAGSSREDNWNALFATIKLFRRLAVTIARDLSYSYPSQLDTEITTYLNKIKTLGTNATDLN